MGVSWEKEPTPRGIWLEASQKIYEFRRIDWNAMEMITTAQQNSMFYQ